MEQIDVLDCAGRRTGETILRDEAHRAGVWHGAFHCLIVSRGTDGGRAFFQKRSAGKLIAPGRFDVSVGGHYSTGEDARTAGPREIREELGLDVRFDELISLGRRTFVYCFTPGVREFEFQDVFLVEREIGADSFTVPEEEVEGVLSVGVEEGISLFSGRQASVEGIFLADGGVGERRRVTTDDFVPCLDNYYLKLLLLARRYLQGERENLVV